MSGRGAAQFIGYGLTALSVWLAWEILKAPVAQRAPPALAVRVAPASPEVLRRAAESELAAGRGDNASALAADSLARAPFDARALRVRGLAAAEAGQTAQADQLVTLAGNWSLRDDPAHAWLVEQRLRQGDYKSSFAHADTLVRRRTDIRPQVFSLFETASVADPKALQAVATLLAANPPWRRAYFTYLQGKPERDALLFALAVALESSPARFTSTELSWLYQRWLSERRFGAVVALREQIKRPDQADLLLNGEFSRPTADRIEPFGWKLGIGSGLTVEVVEDDQNARNLALRTEYDGYGSRTLTSQVLTLKPGRYLFSAYHRVESDAGLASLSWRLTCIDTGAKVAELPIGKDGTTAGASWVTTRVPLVVIDTGCTVQRLSLTPRPADRRTPITAWFDNLQIRRSPDADL